MILDTLLAVGLILSTAGQLRMAGQWIGPGELCLAVWIIMALGYVRPSQALTPALSRLLMFWLILVLAQSVGLVNGLATEDFRDTTSAVHDTLALMLVAALTCLSVVMPDAAHRLRRVTWIAVTFGAVCLAVLVAGAVGRVHLPGLDLWWNGWNRLRGWSENPNQFGLLCSVLVILSLHLAETAARPIASLSALICAIPPFVGGVLSQSDSFILVMLVGGTMFVALKLWTWLFSVERELSLRATFACVIFFATPALLAAAAPFAPTILDKAQRVATETMEKNEQAENRFKLWREAIELGIQANMVGLGPGPHLVNKVWKRPPPNKFEAHFVVLDLFTQGGLLAALSFVWLIATTCLIAHRAQLAALTTLILSLFVFSMFHNFIFRHPVFWFSIALCLAMGDAARGRVPTKASTPDEEIICG
jgi:O-Antigen ligase